MFKSMVLHLTWILSLPRNYWITILPHRTAYISYMCHLRMFVITCYFYNYIDLALGISIISWIAWQGHVTRSEIWIKEVSVTPRMRTTDGVWGFLLCCRYFLHTTQITNFIVHTAVITSVSTPHGNDKLRFNRHFNFASTSTQVIGWRGQSSAKVWKLWKGSWLDHWK